MNSDKFALTHGIRKWADETTNSSGITYHDSYDDAVEKFIEDEKFYARFGYVTWCGNIIRPDGTVVILV